MSLDKCHFTTYLMQSMFFLLILMDQLLDHEDEEETNHNDKFCYRIIKCYFSLYPDIGELHSNKGDEPHKTYAKEYSCRETVGK